MDSHYFGFPLSTPHPLTTDGNIWIIETKGGMQAGHTKNIDRQVENKFNAFKEYAKKYNLH